MRSVEPQTCPSSPDSELTSVPGRASCGQCANNFYRNGAVEASLLTCKPCPPHATCKNDATLAAVVPNKGHWRAASTSPVIYACRGSSGGVQGAQCVGEAAADEPWPHTYCANNHEGPLCEVCTESQHFFDKETGECEECDLAGTIGRIAGIAGGTIAAIALLLLLSVRLLRCCGYDVTLSGLRDKMAHISEQLSLPLIFKELLGFFQVVGVLSTVYAVVFPDEFADWADALGYLGLDIGNVLLPGACVSGVIPRLLLFASLPLQLTVVWTLLNLLLESRAVQGVLAKSVGVPQSTRIGVAADPTEARPRIEVTEAQATNCGASFVSQPGLQIRDSIDEEVEHNNITDSWAGQLEGRRKSLSLLVSDTQDTSLSVQSSLPPGGGQRKRRTLLASLALVCLSPFTITSFCFVSPISRLVLNAYGDCISFYTDETATVGFLRMDPAVVCESSEHTSIKAVAIPLFVLWALGLPALYAALLHYCRKPIQRDEPSATKEAISFMWSEYHPNFYMWEPMDMLRRREL